MESGRPLFSGAYFHLHPQCFCIITPFLASGEVELAPFPLEPVSTIFHHSERLLLMNANHFFLLRGCVGCFFLFSSLPTLSFKGGKKKHFQAWVPRETPSSTNQILFSHQQYRNIVPACPMQCEICL